MKEPISLYSATLCVRHSVATSLLFGRTYSMSWRAPVRKAGGSHQALPLAWCWHWTGVEGTEIWQPCHKNQTLQTPGKETHPPPLTNVRTHKHKVKKSSRSECTHAATACQRRSTWRVSTCRGWLGSKRMASGGRGGGWGASGRQKHSLNDGTRAEKPAHTRPDDPSVPVCSRSTLTSLHCRPAPGWLPGLSFLLHHLLCPSCGYDQRQALRETSLSTDITPCLSHTCLKCLLLIPSDASHQPANEQLWQEERETEREEGKGGEREGH